MFGRTPRIIVVGAGVGALACAIDLGARGVHVLVLERATSAGGKMRSATVGGVAIDCGPTVLTMPWALRELFESAGATLDDYVDLERAHVVARHAWPDGTRLDLFADQDESAEAIARVFGEREARGYLAYRQDGQRIFATAEEPFLRAQRPTVGSLVGRLGVLGVGALGRIDAFRTMWAAISSRFEDRRLRQLFGRYATYCGSSPFEAPATLGIIPHVEAQGVFRVRGGMRMLASALERLAREHGVDLRCGEEVERIVVRDGVARGVVSNGAYHDADAVVFNGDVSALRGLLGGDAAGRAPKPTPTRERSLSAVTFAIVGRTAGLPLVHHNVLFSDDYAAELDALVGARVMPAMPTVYVCAQDRADAEMDLGEERMLLVVNAPATGDEPSRWTNAERKRCEEKTFTTMRRCGLSIEPSAMEQTTPMELAQRFPGTGGAIYGPISRGPFSALARQGARTKVRGLYLAGGSVHPGPGVPMAVLSGRLASAQLRADIPSTRLSPKEVTHGTTSTA